MLVGCYEVKQKHGAFLLSFQKEENTTTKCLEIVETVASTRAKPKAENEIIHHQNNLIVIAL